MEKVVNQAQVAAEPVDWDGGTDAKIQWLIGESDGAQNFFMRRIVIEPGGYSPKHSHNYEHESYVVSGKGQVLVDQKWISFDKDSVIFIPELIEHQFVNVGTDQLILISVIPKK
jgi:quercetin dioxygenase-like cupin family protein